MSLNFNSQLCDQISVKLPEQNRAKKYQRFQNEKRVDREKGMKRIQTPRIITTKWDPEIANKKTNKIGRKRERDYKYGNWDWNRTDSCCEDKANKAINEATRERLSEDTAKFRRGFHLLPLAKYSDIRVPLNELEQATKWPWGAYDSSEERAIQVLRAPMRGLTIQRVPGVNYIIYALALKCDTLTYQIPGRACGTLREERIYNDDYEYILIGNELREDFDAEDDWSPI